ncbi:hypothetical protein [Paraburkholderia sp. BL10I2N1]|uniref:hypothetical protein n=1 Tax=Paraburkholderia sp. BL10I2N1 TaxID=1938796 RepID=UPI00105C4E00|nr:hypothetical protein [Paraburkholderia sp. BL10I2N1]TDN70784.1 hypothetical protein B0G77_4280 [Paraburkholderia sp. BL10I2N1]
MKFIFRALAIFIAGGCAVVHATNGNVLPKFVEYSVNVYHGQLKVPAYYKKTDGEWRDDMGKLVQPPGVNFAGKYYIGVHSCGADCRYYTLSDLVSGSDSSALDMFSNDQGHPLKTSDGRTYMTSLVSRPDSKMLVAQYHIEQGDATKEQCRERFFSLDDDGKEVRPITKTLNFCTESH